MRDSIIGSHRFDLAVPLLKRMLRYAYATRDMHTVAAASSTVGMYYSMKGDHVRGEKWYWKSIATLCKFRDICPFCLSNAFIALGHEHLTLGKCTLANDRFAKGLKVALLTKSLYRQAKALHCLASHLTWHDELKAGIAAYVWVSRIYKEMDPTQEEADVNVLLGEVVVKHGRVVVEKILSEVEVDPRAALEEYLEPFKIKDFTDQLGMKPTNQGDH